MRTPAELTAAFRERGMKVTPQRELIFRLLHGSVAHPTAESVYEAARAVMPTLSLRTVYQTLNDLAAMGEIQAVDLGTGSARFDPNTDSHHHFVCRDCGSVSDVYVDTAPLRTRSRDFAVDAVEVVLRGLCAACGAGSTRPPATVTNGGEST